MQIILTYKKNINPRGLRKETEMEGIKKESNNEKEVVENDIAGKRFEDLNKEEMDKIQGSGNSDVEVEGITDLILSKGNYIC